MQVCRLLIFDFTVSEVCLFTGKKQLYTAGRLYVLRVRKKQRALPACVISRIPHVDDYFLFLFKSTLGTKTHTFATDNTLFFINLRQGIYIPLCNSSLGTNRYGRACMVLRALLRIYYNFHVVSPSSSWQYSFLMDSIKAITRLS